MNNRLGSGWLGPLLFLAGVAVGWFVIGWWLWPATGNVRPPQLETNARLDYLALVADSYAVNGNVNIVRLRLQGFNLDEAGRDLDDLATRSQGFGLTDQAQRLRNLANVVRRELGASTPQATAAPKTGTSAQPGASLVDQFFDALGGLRQGWLVGLVLALVIIAVAVWAALRWRLDRLLMGSPRTVPDDGSTTGPMARRRADDEDDQVPVYVSLNQLTRISYTSDGPDRTEVRIIDANKDMVGQIELRAAEILGRTPDEPPAALELRLFDRHEPRTRVAVLVSHAASQDPTARQLIASMSSDYVKPGFDVSRLGRTVHLDTRFIHLEAEVVDAVIDEGGSYPTFQFLSLEIAPMPASQAPPPAVLDEGQEDAEDERTLNLSRVDDEDDEDEDNPR